MARRRKNQNISKREVGVLVCLIATGMMLTVSGAALIVAGIAILLAVLWSSLSLYPRWKNSKRLQVLGLEGVDNLNGYEFEEYVAELLNSQGYSTQVTRKSGDDGVDVIAEKDGVRCSVQCKRYGVNVDRKAVTDAVGAMNLHRCTRAMVVTNRAFTAGAVRIAKSWPCELIDRDKLASWIIEYRSPGASKSIPWIPISAAASATILALVLIVKGLTVYSDASTSLAQIGAPPSSGSVSTPTATLPDDQDFGRLGKQKVEQLEINRLGPLIEQRLLTESDIGGLSENAFTILRNVPYARHGLKFRRSELAKYFSHASWYSPRSDNAGAVESKMNPFERANVQFIAAHQKGNGSKD